MEDARKPALFTRDFGDCLGSSVVNVTRFDAAYYKDNGTVVFHLQGSTSIANESLMMYIGVFAYGESRFDLTFDPCSANIDNLCPMRTGVPIEANGTIAVAPADVANIPEIAMSIPDFEGQAILRLFSNSTQSQIGCYQAVVTNGATLSQPKAVGSILGIFTLVAVVASFATAVYGDDVPTTRTHYAHSLSVAVVFAVFHHIYFFGALSLDWPSVLPAFWSNFAWPAGMIYSDRMQDSINNFLETNLRNSSVVGAAAPRRSRDGGQSLVLLNSIYKEQQPSPPVRRDLTAVTEGLLRRSLGPTVVKRSTADATDRFPWYGQPVKPGLPLPGDFYGFAGTLAKQRIPASNAFLTALLWLLILLAFVAAAVVVLKWTLELGMAAKLVKKERLAFFRAHWLRFVWQAILKMLLVAFFMMMVLTQFQFARQGPAGVTAIAAVIFIVFLVGIFGVVGYACFERLRQGRYEVTPDRLRLRRKRLWKAVPWVELVRESKADDGSSERPPAGFSIPWRSVRYVDEAADRTSIHNDTDYVLRFGWLTARFRRTRWWFFAVWAGYEFLRACFHGGGAANPMAQVFGLLILEIVALIAIVRIRPFEGARLNALLVYLLGFSKVVTVALSAAFDSGFNLARIQTTIVGIVIVVIQGILTIAVLIAIVLGAISSYFSVTRNRELIRPRTWAPMRERYFKHLEETAVDLPPAPPSPPTPVPTSPYFKVESVRRFPKIEDEDSDFVAEINDPSASRISMPGASARGRRSTSVGGANGAAPLNTVPFGARVHRASWSTREFEHTRAGEPRRSSISTQRQQQQRHSSLYGSPGITLPAPGAAGLSSTPRTSTQVTNHHTIEEQDRVSPA